MSIKWDSFFKLLKVIVKKTFGSNISKGRKANIVADTIAIIPCSFLIIFKEGIIGLIGFIIYIIFLAWCLSEVK